MNVLYLSLVFFVLYSNTYYILFSYPTTIKKSVYNSVDQELSNYYLIEKRQLPS